MVSSGSRSLIPSHLWPSILSSSPISGSPQCWNYQDPLSRLRSLVFRYLSLKQTRSSSSRSFLRKLHKTSNSTGRAEVKHQRLDWATCLSETGSPMFMFPDFEANLSRVARLTTAGKGEWLKTLRTGLDIKEGLWSDLLGLLLFLFPKL